MAALLSITGRTNGFLYRCRNDPNYTMLYISLKMLALNARIEAARRRTGPRRRCVAKEIKTLATTSGTAAERITRLMNELQVVMTGETRA